MSPLVSPLLALAALLATGSAAVLATGSNPIDDRCASLHIGQYNNNYNDQVFHIDPPAKIPIQNKCPGGVIVGEDIVACNSQLHGRPPVIYPTGNDQYLDYGVYCPYGCPDGVDVVVRQYCAY